MKKDNGRDLEALARKGRGGDTEIGHLTEGELVVPAKILQKLPELRDALAKAFQESGMDLDRYIVGSEENSVNPRTGAREFYEGYGGSAGDFDDSDARNQGQGPDSQDARGGDGYGGPGIGNEGGGGGNRFGSGGGRQMTLPAEYADFILEDGRRLEDVLGKSFFKGGQARAVWFARSGRQAGQERRACARAGGTPRAGQTAEPDQVNPDQRPGCFRDRQYGQKRSVRRVRGRRPPRPAVSDDFPIRQEK